jgi:hypothetical protein
LSYVHNFRGQVIESHETDSDISRFKYRRDGKIRFSQNALQAANELNGTVGKGRFSYTNYDDLGRPTESGEHIGSLTFASLDNQVNGLDNTAISSQRKDWNEIRYDNPALETGIAMLDDKYQQYFTKAAVSATENENIITRYSYDELGRITWMMQQPKMLDRIFVVEYSYDFLGNTTRVANLSYSTDGALVSEFYHHYEYDKDLRLDKVYTSRQVDGAKDLRAKYEYYLHGPLKRIELGGNLQGIDMVYNINGWLTHINNPDAAQDPGKDGQTGAHGGFSKDAFGMILDYYESSISGLYQTSANTDIHGIPANAFTNQLYNQPLLRFPADLSTHVEDPSFKKFSAGNPAYLQQLQNVNPNR